MNERRGLFLAIEGTDGSGKGTQFKLLAERLKSLGYELVLFDFPQYDAPSSFFVKEYLNGRYGTAEEVGPYAGSLFFSLDRYQASPLIRQALEEGKIVLANRFTGSNMAHQGTKFNHVEERRGFFIWLDNLEFQMLGIPRPDRSMVLRVPAVVAQSLVDQKEARTYTSQKRDLHEADLQHLERSVEVYDDLCQLFPKDFQRLDCVKNDKLLSITAVNNILWEAVEPLLPPKPAVKKGSITMPHQETSEQPTYLQKADNQWVITPAGREFLSAVVTNVDSNVYAFTPELGALTVAAAMARLSRRGDDMRITILDEFAGEAGRDEKLLQRVISAYGDDSVQQLVGQHVVVEGASNLLTKQLEWGRLAAYLEQSTRYIRFDEKDKDGRYKYYVPEQLDEATKVQYQATLDQIFELYSMMLPRVIDHIGRINSTPKAEQDGAWRNAVRGQALDAVRPVLPVATKSTVGIFASAQALEAMIMRLRASDSPEARTVGEQVLTEARKVIPAMLERADLPERGGAMTAYLANTHQAVASLAEQYLPEHHSGEVAPVSLKRFWPRNEIDLVAHMLYEHSGLSLEEIQAQVDSWPMDRKIEVFNTYMGERLNRRHRPGRALEQAHYTFDLVCDYGIFRDLQRHRMVDDLEWQALSPRYGFEVPELIDATGLIDEFERCFELSAQLYSQLQAAGYSFEAQYATLLGHKMRWTVTYNAREAFHLHELRTSPQGHPGYRKLVQEMHERVAQVHPMIAEAMKFVNQGEDPELARLAAERYSQYKFQQLS